MKLIGACPGFVLFGLMVLLFLTLISCGRGMPTEPLVLNDFESLSDLERIAWRCRTTFALTKDNSSHGQSGVLMTVYPDLYPGLHLLLSPEERRWRRYRYLALEVFNPESEALALAYRIDDCANPDYADRVNGSFRLRPGLNRLRLDLSHMLTSETNRALNLDHIDNLLFFLVSPSRRVSLVVDYVRLEPDVLPR